MKHFRVEMDEPLEEPVQQHRPEPVPQAALYQAALNKRNQLIFTYFN